MQREIKFRTFIPSVPSLNGTNNLLDGGQMVYGLIGYTYQNKIVGEAIKDDIIGNGGIIMQYTGLKDKNGKEIYEGDILLTDDTYHDYQDGIAINSLPDGKFVEVIFADGAFLVNNELLYEVANNYEVIGNIYQNYELLK